MPQIDLSAEARAEFGKGPARRLRAAGRVPAVIYGTETDVTAVSLSEHELELALRVPEVILKITIGSGEFTVAPRQVQRDPVRRNIEHLDLVVLNPREVRERLVVGRAVQAAEQAAIEAELEPVAVITALHELLESGVEADEAVAAAVVQVREQVAAQAAAAAAAADAEDAASASEAAEAEQASESGEA